ncbi:MAG: hypothetical protein ACTSR8_01780 [Promethearchaeota archaeon]
MAKKKKEVCPYCGKSFAYLSRHKCRIKERVEGVTDEKSDSERRIERIEETKKTIRRNLKKDEKHVLDIINEKKDIYFNDLLEEIGCSKNELESIIDVLVMQSKIKMRRELISAAWTRHLYALEDYKNIEVQEKEIDRTRKDFLWNLFGRQPCFICPVSEKCNEDNLDQFNPHHCPWLTNWIETMLAKQEFNINFEEFKDNLGEY